VLVTTGLLLLTGLQFAFLGPSLIARLTNANLAGRRDVVGGMLRMQRRFVPVAGLASAYVIGLAWWSGLLDDRLAILCGFAALAGMATLQREFFRTVLLAYRRPLAVLKSDAVYVALLVVGALTAAATPQPAVVAVLTLALATLVGGAMLGLMVWRHEGWNIDGAPGILREIAPVGAWAVFGAGVHWAFNQGYTYVVAGVLDIQAVAAIAATRLLLMPVNLLSQGVSQITLPTVSTWLRDHGVSKVFERLVLLCAAVCGLAVCYCAVLWVARDLVFDHVLKRQIAHRDLLLGLWSAVFIVTALRDQLAHLLTATGRLRELSSVTFASAVLAIAVTYFATLRVGTGGAVAGILAGELANVLGIVAISVRQSRRIPALCASIP